MQGVVLTKQKIIPNPKGDILHALKKTDAEFESFGEVYFSSIKVGEIKGWKKHTKMVMNLLVPFGEVEFVIFDGCEFKSIILSRKNYYRLTISSDLWVAFKGRGVDESLIMNFASILHDPEEAISCTLDEIDYRWNE